MLKDSPAPENAAPIMAAIYCVNDTRLAACRNAEAQAAICRKYAADIGFVIAEDHVYIDINPNQLDALAVLLQTSAHFDQPFSAVLVMDARIIPVPRREGDIARLHSNDITLHMCKERLSSRDQNFPLALSFFSIFDQQLSARHGELTRRGQRTRVLDGLYVGGNCVGYRTVPVSAPPMEGTGLPPLVRGYALATVPEAADVIRNIYQRYVDGASPKEIADEFNANGLIAGPSNLPPKWSSKSILNVLSDRRYVGEVVWG